jgi:3-hydroxybutyryl-CoA dehydrogenase
MSIHTVAVIGGGTMGAGIAHRALIRGCSVILLERDRDACGAVAARILAGVKKPSDGAEPYHPATELVARLTLTADRVDLRSADLVIEAVPESLTLKAEVLANVESVVCPAALIATNTSSLSIDVLSSSMQNPARLVGMHFFNPVPKSAVVEVVRGRLTSERALAGAHKFAAQLGLVSIEVANTPGFATSRLGVLLGLEAIRMVEEGVASAAGIDQAMVLAYRHPIGPLRLGDLIGLDVRLGIAEYLTTQLGSRFEPPSLLREMVAAGTLGRKTGQGFYSWT